jgi:glycosyltransferase involved in cell wall biosynthesis
MRILHIIPTLDQGGAEKLLLDVVTADVQNEHIIVKLLVGQDFFGKCVSGQCIDLNLSRNKLKFLFQLPYAVTRLGILCYRIRPDVAVGWLYYGALLASIAAIMGVPTIWTIHASDVKPFSRVVRATARLCALLSKRIPEAIHYCSVEGRIAHEALGFHPAASVVIFNGIDAAAYCTDTVPPLTEEETTGCERVLEEIKRSRPRSTIFGCIARFHSQKDHETLFGAMANLARQGKPFHLVLAGSGCDWRNPELSRLIDRFGLRDRVVAVGAVPNIERLYRYLDCVVLSSAYGESMPLCLLEALAAGKPVVATDVGATREIIGPFGIVTPPLNVDAFADAIERVAWGRNFLRISARTLAPRYVESEYGLQQCVAHWASLLNDAAVARAKRGKTQSEIGSNCVPDPGADLYAEKYGTS